jgi:hypothetical protein
MDNRKTPSGRAADVDRARGPRYARTHSRTVTEGGLRSAMLSVERLSQRQVGTWLFHGWAIVGIAC